MKINAKWSREIALSDGRKQNMIYHLNVTGLPKKAGCYVFYNSYGNSHGILYIGKAENLQNRVEQQLNNVKLMMGIKNSGAGHKKIIYCTLSLAQGQSEQKALDVLEKCLIKHSLSEGHELLNQSGTRIYYDSLKFKGNRDSEKLFGRKINIEK